MSSAQRSTPPVQPQQNVAQVVRLEAKAQRERPRAVRLATRLSAAAGSAASIVVHVLWFSGWIAMNTGLIPGVRPFDPFPFSFLTLVVSLEAIFLTLMVLLGQNRVMSEADRRALLDLQVNMLAEQEGTMTLRMLRKICNQLGIESDETAKAFRLEEATDIAKLAKSLDDQLSK